MPSARHESPIVDYLLGRLSDEDNTRLEQDFLTDDAVHDHLLAAEDELFLAYARGELSSDDRQRVEQRLIRTDRDRERLAWARTLASWFDREKRAAGPGSRTGSPFPVPDSRFFLPLAALLAIAIGALLLQNVSLRRTVQEAEQARAAAEQELVDARRNAADRAALAKQVEELQARLTPPSGGDPPPGKTTPFMVTLALSPGQIRGSGTMPRVTLPAAATHLQLRLTLPPDIARRPYGVAVRDVDGRTLWTGLASVSGQTLLVQVPSQPLVRGDYELVLRESGGSPEAVGVAEYYFSVSR